MRMRSYQSESWPSNPVWLINRCALATSDAAQILTGAENDVHVNKIIILACRLSTLASASLFLPI